MDFIRDTWSDGFVGKATVFLLVVLVMMIPLLIYGSIESQKKWEKFKSEHSCKVVGQIKGDMHTGVGFGVTANGQIGTALITSSTPDKTGWLCDDGITYWR